MGLTKLLAGVTNPFSVTCPLLNQEANVAGVTGQLFWGLLGGTTAGGDIKYSPATSVDMIVHITTNDLNRKSIKLNFCA